MKTDTLLSPPQVEEIYNIPTTTLEQWRFRKVGPAYHKLGKHIRYKARDVDEWIEKRRVLTMP
ncbi:MAG: hypothetical protein DELT_00395 [Desulfovibrio sp.]